MAEGQRGSLEPPVMVAPVRALRFVLGFEETITEGVIG